jgi:hypothetical protein
VTGGNVFSSVMIGWISGDVGLLWLVVMFFVVAMIGWISGDVGLLWLVVIFVVVAMIGWISGDVCFIVTGGNVYFFCYDWLDKWWCLFYCDWW